MDNKDTFTISVDVPVTLEYMSDSIKLRFESMVLSIESAYHAGVYEGRAQMQKKRFDSDGDSNG